MDHFSPPRAPQRAPPARQGTEVNDEIPEYYTMQSDQHQQQQHYTQPGVHPSADIVDSTEFAPDEPHEELFAEEEGDDLEEEEEEEEDDEDDPFSPPKRSQPWHESFDAGSSDFQPEDEHDTDEILSYEAEEGPFLSYEEEEGPRILEDERANAADADMRSDSPQTTADMDMEHGVLDEAMWDTHISTGNNQFAPLVNLESAAAAPTIPVTSEAPSPRPEETQPSEAQQQLHPHDLRRLPRDKVIDLKKTLSKVKGIWRETIDGGTTVLKPTVVFLRGIPGVGKTSMVRRLGEMCVDTTFPEKLETAERRELVESMINCGRTECLLNMDLRHDWTWLAVCSADHLFESGDGYERDSSRLDQVHKSAQMAFRKALAANIPLIIVDNTNTQQFEIEDYLEILRNTEVNPIVVNEGVPSYVPEGQLVNTLTLEFVCPNEITVVCCYARCLHGVPLGKCLKMWKRWEAPAPNPLYIKPGGMAKELWDPPTGTDPLYFTKLLASDTMKLSTNTAVNRSKANELKSTLEKEIYKNEKLLPIEKALYAGIMLTKRSIAELRRSCPPCFEEESCHHVTISFRPRKSLLGSLPVGEKVKFACHWEIQGRDAQAVSVKPIRHPPKGSEEFWSQFGNSVTSNTVPHVTISTRKNVKAKYSNQLLERWYRETESQGTPESTDDWWCKEFDRRLEIEGVVGITVGKDHPYGGHSERRTITDIKEYRVFCSAHQIELGQNTKPRPTMNADSSKQKKVDPQTSQGQANGTSRKSANNASGERTKVRSRSRGSKKKAKSEGGNPNRERIKSVASSGKDGRSSSQNSDKTSEKGRNRSSGNANLAPLGDDNVSAELPSAKARGSGPNRARRWDIKKPEEKTRAKERKGDEK